MTADEQSRPDPIQLPSSPNLIRTAAVAELDRLGALVANLSPADWSKASAVEGWSIGDVVVHLNLAMGMYRRILSAVLTGRGAGPLWKALGQAGRAITPAASPTFHAINSRIPHLIDKTLSPEVIRGQSAAGNRQLRAAIERFGSEDYSRPVYYIGGPWPLSFFLSGVVNEISIHGWDIASRLDPSAHLSSDACAVIPWFWWSGTPFMLRLPNGTTGSVQVMLSDPVLEMWWSLEGKTPRQGTGQTEHPRVTITGTAASFVLTQAGRLPVDQAFLNTTLESSGDRELARIFLSSWNIV